MNIENLEEDVETKLGPVKVAEQYPIGFCRDYKCSTAPFLNPTIGFFVTTAKRFPGSSKILEAFYDFLSDLHWGFRRSDLPKERRFWKTWTPFYKKGVLYNPRNGFSYNVGLTTPEEQEEGTDPKEKEKGEEDPTEHTSSTAENTDSSRTKAKKKKKEIRHEIAYVEPQGFFQSILANPNKAKFILPEKYPIKLTDGSTKEIEHAPVYRTSPFTTMPLARLAAKERRNEISVGDFVGYANDNKLGFVKSIFLKENMGTNVFADIQKVGLASDFQLETDVQSREHILLPSIDRDVLLSTVESRNFTTMYDKSDVNKVWISRELIDVPSTTVTQFIPPEKCDFSKAPPDSLPDLPVVILCMQLTKDAFLSYCTRGAMLDIANFSCRDLPFADQERFGRVSTIFACSTHVSAELRQMIVAKIIREAEQGLVLYHSTLKRLVFAIASSSVMVADMSEYTDTTGTVKHTPTATILCFRCPVTKAQLLSLRHFQRAIPLTSSRLRFILKEATTQAKTNELKSLKKEYGVKQYASFLALKSLKVPENAVADRLHTLEINCVSWVCAAFWACLNKEGRGKLNEGLKLAGTELRNYLVITMFTWQKSLMRVTTLERDDKPDLVITVKQIRQTVTATKNSLRLKATDYDGLLGFLDLIIARANKSQHFGKVMARLLQHVTEEQTKDLQEVLGTSQSSFASIEIWGHLFKSLIQGYWSLKDKRTSTEWMSTKREYSLKVLRIVELVFDGVLNKPCFHDVFHLLEQNEEVLASCEIDSGPAEGHHKIERKATKSGNFRHSPKDVVTQQYDFEMNQFILDGGYFQVPGDWVKAGIEIQKQLAFMCRGAKNLYTLPKVTPVVPYDWFQQNKVPNLCNDSITVRSFLTEGGARVEKTDLSQVLDSAHTLDDVHITSLYLTKQYILAKKIVLPKAGASRVGEVIEIDSKLIPPQLAAAYSLRRPDGSHGVLLLLNDIMCCVKNANASSFLLRETRKIQNQIDQEKKKLDDQMRIMHDAEFEAIALAKSIKTKEESMDQLMRAEQEKWLPEVILRGTLLEPTTSSYSFSACQTMQKNNASLVTLAKHIVGTYPVLEEMEDGKKLLLRKFY